MEYNSAAAAWNTTKVSTVCHQRGSLDQMLDLLSSSWQLPGTHAIGVTAVSWAPAVPPGALVSAKTPGQFVKRLVTAGCDNVIKVMHVTWGLLEYEM